MFRGPEVFLRIMTEVTFNMVFFSQKKKCRQRTCPFLAVGIFFISVLITVSHALRSEDRIALKTTILGQKGHFLSRDYKFTFESLEEVEIVQRQ